tara:strand:- start:2888 stop:3913 length:1026 start_codon:yes stop_codon:yes gene_type:complete
MINSMSLVHRLFICCICISPFSFSWSQTGNTYVSRDAFYDSLEARAKALSQRLADLSGTEPIPFDRPPPTILSTRQPTTPAPNQAQSAFDALPDPTRDLEKPVKQKADDGTLYRADGTPVPVNEEVPKVPAKKRLPRKEMERDRGQYFIQPFVGLAFLSSDVSLSIPAGFVGGVKQSADIDIETEVGHTVGLALGRRWQNFEGELHFSFSSVGYGSADISNPTTSFSELDMPASGEIELFQIGARAGYGLPVGESGWVRAAGGFGYGKRRDFLSIQPISIPSMSYGNTDSAFTYDLLFSFGYEIEWGLDAFLAYRLLGSSGNGDFDKVAMHLFEVGLGANF